MGGTVEFRFGASYHGTTAGDLRARINAADAAGTFAYRADYAGDGRFRLNATEATTELTFANRAMLDIVGLGGETAGDAPVLGTVNPERDALQQEVSDVLDQIDQIIADSGVLGATPAAGEMLGILLNERGTRLVHRSNPIHSVGLGLRAQSVADMAASGLGDVIAQARTRLMGEQGRWASAMGTIEIREAFTASLVEVLRSGADDLTLADPNAEGARLLAAQTSEQLGLQALRLATEADQDVLALFR